MRGLGDPVALCPGAGVRSDMADGFGLFAFLPLRTVRPYHEGVVSLGCVWSCFYGHAETLHFVQTTSMSCGSPLALKPSAKLSTVIEHSRCKRSTERPPTRVRLTVPVLPHNGHLGFSTHRSRIAISHTCALVAPIARPWRTWLFECDSSGSPAMSPVVARTGPRKCHSTP